MSIEDLITLIVNNGTAIALLCYFIYKDNRFTGLIHKSLNSIDNSLKSIEKLIGRDGDDK